MTTTKLTKLTDEERERVNRIVHRARYLKGEGWSNFDAFLRARVEEDAAEWLATLPFGEAHEPEPGHRILARYYYGEQVEQDMAASYVVAQRWAPVFGMEDYHEWGLLFAQLVSRKYYGQSPSRR